MGTKCDTQIQILIVFVMMTTFKTCFLIVIVDSLRMLNALIFIFNICYNNDMWCDLFRSS